MVLWMISGNTRIAYERIPAHDVMYLESKNNDACGKFCGKVIDLSLKVTSTIVLFYILILISLLLIIVGLFLRVVVRENRAKC